MSVLLSCDEALLSRSSSLDRECDSGCGSELDDERDNDCDCDNERDGECGCNCDIECECDSNDESGKRPERETEALAICGVGGCKDIRGATLFLLIE